MIETDNHTQGQKAKVSKLAIASPFVVILGFLTGLALAGWLKSNEFLENVGFWTFIISLPIGLITGIIADRRICKSKGLLTGRPFSILGTIMALILIVHTLIPSPTPVRKIPNQVLCHINLHSFGVAMLIYASDYNDQYPAADKWCDLLLQHTEISEKQFVCRAALKKGDKGPSHYAMNPNCEPNSPPDMVLLFETEGGWNQYGGPEIMTFENHEGKGCNILFNDGSVKFVMPEEVSELKWKVEENNSNSIE